MAHFFFVRECIFYWNIRLKISLFIILIILLLVLHLPLKCILVWGTHSTLSFFKNQSQNSSKRLDWQNVNIKTMSPNFNLTISTYISECDFLFYFVWVTDRDWEIFCSEERTTKSPFFDFGGNICSIDWDDRLHLLQIFDIRLNPPLIYDVITTGQVRLSIRIICHGNVLFTLLLKGGFTKSLWNTSNIFLNDVTIREHQSQLVATYLADTVSSIAMRNSFPKQDNQYEHFLFILFYIWFILKTTTLSQAQCASISTAVRERKTINKGLIDV